MKVDFFTNANTHSIHLFLVHLVKKKTKNRQRYFLMKQINLLHKWQAIYQLFPAIRHGVRYIIK